MRDDRDGDAVRVTISRGLQAGFEGMKWASSSVSLHFLILGMVREKVSECGR